MRPPVVTPESTRRVRREKVGLCSRIYSGSLQPRGHRTMASRMRRMALTRDIITTEALIRRSQFVVPFMALIPPAHYWDYYRLDPGHGMDVDRTMLP
jgi:hypothetical protein